jgi:hypothetical protein
MTGVTLEPQLPGSNYSPVTAYGYHHGAQAVQQALRE